MGARSRTPRSMARPALDWSETLRRSAVPRAAHRKRGKASPPSTRDSAWRQSLRMAQECERAAREGARELVSKHLVADVRTAWSETLRKPMAYRARELRSPRVPPAPPSPRAPPAKKKKKKEKEKPEPRRPWREKPTAVARQVVNVGTSPHHVMRHAQTSPDKFRMIASGVDAGTESCDAAVRWAALRHEEFVVDRSGGWSRLTDPRFRPLTTRERLAMAALGAAEAQQFQARAAVAESLHYSALSGAMARLTDRAAVTVDRDQRCSEVQSAIRRAYNTELYSAGSWLDQAQRLADTQHDLHAAASRAVRDQLPPPPPFMRVLRPPLEVPWPP